jgi:2-dehydro-3-deoxyphosphogluconate aldolase/(4S)-4-hydroxy-2-oxoglutarate aldolase
MSTPAQFDLARFAAMPLIAILRSQPAHVIDPVVQTLIEGGFTALEVTMNTPGAAQQISAAVASAKNKLAIGAGTVPVSSSHL